MKSAAVPFDLDDSPSLWDRIVSDFPSAAEEWSRSINRLNRWEDEKLLPFDNPPPEALERHRKIIERLMFFGQLCAFVATSREYGDDVTAGMVTASQEVLRNKLRMFHRPRMSKEESDRILAEVFPES
jgi:hypothetical protein